MDHSAGAVGRYIWRVLGERERESFGGCILWKYSDAV